MSSSLTGGARHRSTPAASKACLACPERARPMTGIDAPWAEARCSRIAVRGPPPGRCKPSSIATGFIWSVMLSTEDTLLAINVSYPSAPRTRSISGSVFGMPSAMRITGRSLMNVSRMPSAGSEVCVRFSLPCNPTARRTAAARLRYADTDFAGRSRGADAVYHDTVARRRDNSLPCLSTQQNRERREKQLHISHGLLSIGRAVGRYQPGRTGPAPAQRGWRFC